MNFKGYKYENDLNSIEGIEGIMPDIQFIFHEPAYRFTFALADGGKIKNHLPVYKSEPTRFIKAIEKKNVNPNGLSLSCFNNFENAISKYKWLKNIHQNFEKAHGNCISCGKLNSYDGMISELNDHGHFELFEFDECDLNSKFVEIMVLK
jgi:hypothetical protein